MWKLYKPLKVAMYIDIPCIVSCWRNMFLSYRSPRLYSVFDRFLYKCVEFAHSIGLLKGKLPILGKTLQAKSYTRRLIPLSHLWVWSFRQLPVSLKDKFTQKLRMVSLSMFPLMDRRFEVLWSTKLFYSIFRNNKSMKINKTMNENEKWNGTVHHCLIQISGSPEIATFYRHEGHVDNDHIFTFGWTYPLT